MERRGVDQRDLPAKGDLGVPLEHAIAFVYNNAGCVVTFSPYRDRGREAFAVQTSGMCTGQNAHLAAINGNYVRRR